MIKRLQQKFVAIVAVSLFIVELLIIGGINIFNIRSIDSDYDKVMNMLVENDGMIPDFPRRDDGFKPDKKMSGDQNRMNDRNFNEETKYQTRYFIVYYSSNGNVSGVNTGHIAAVDSQRAVEYAAQALESGDEKGSIDIYKYSVNNTDKGKMVIFLDARSGSENKKRFLLISAVVAAAGYLLTCLLVIIFSKRAVRPVVDSIEKQRRFITDAGHEIKTPLAIISANTEVIEMTTEESEWTKSIKNQVTRLDGLVKELLRLSKMEEDDVKLVFTEFDASQTVSDAVQSFEALAKTNGKNISTDIADGVIISGDRSAVSQLVGILVENAVKYADDGSDITVSFKKSSSGRHAHLSVSNKCSDPPKDTEKLFDRFYRDDSSRSRDGSGPGGYGIGLSIARAVMNAHKGKITCKAEGNTVTFTAVFKSV